jgi:hypothetical protein
MKSVRIRSSKRGRKTQVPKPEANAPPDPGGDLHALIAKRAYELYAERGYRHGHALDDWLEAEREILSRFPP